MEVQIRRAVPADAGKIAELATALGYPSSAAEVSQRLTNTLCRDDHFVAVAVESSGDVVGWIHACEEIRVESDPKVQIGALIVRDEKRGKGVGPKLLMAAESWATELGISWVQLRSNVVRERAHTFFARMGYSNTKKSRVFDKTLAPEE